MNEMVVRWFNRAGEEVPPPDGSPRDAEIFSMRREWRATRAELCSAGILAKPRPPTNPAGANHAEEA